MDSSESATTATAVISGPADPTRSIAERLSGRDNAFNFLRLMFAMLVIVDHAFPLSGFGADPMWGWSKGQDSMGGIAVAAFFAISGYLITASATKGDLLQFFWRRGLRIFPAFWFVLLFTVAVIAPLLWWHEHRPWAEFTAHACAPKRYLIANWKLEMGQFCIADLLRSTTPYGRTIDESVFNGSLWTLIYEWRCYVLVGLLALGGVLARARVLFVLLTLFFYVMLILGTAKPELVATVVPWLSDIHAIQFTCIFLVGGCLALYANEVPLDDRLGVFSSSVFVVTLIKGGYFALGYPALAYALLWLAARLPPAVRRIGARNDYSYGVYIYGFLVEQILAYFGVHRAGLAVYITVAIVVSYALGAASWHLIERPALRLKDRGPGRGGAYWIDWLRAKRARFGESKAL